LHALLFGERGQRDDLDVSIARAELPGRLDAALKRAFLAAALFSLLAL
jgi:hypothetical protein